MTDPYSILGVSREASDEEIKNAYRKLAKECHPDRNPGDASAEAKFKEIGAAYASIKDGTAQYGGAGGHGGFNPQEFGFNFNFGGPHGGANIEDVIRQWASHQAQRNRNYNTRCTISFQDAFAGCEITLNIMGKDIKIKIPAGVDNGTKIRVHGAGESVHSQSPPGDLYVNLDVLPDSRFGRDGKTLLREITVDCVEAMLGLKIQTETIDGDTVEFEVQSGVQHGHKYRLAGRGMPLVGTTERGDMIVIVNVSVPRNLTEKQIDLLKEFKGLQT